MLFVSTVGDGKSFLVDMNSANVLRNYKSDPVDGCSHSVVYNTRADTIVCPQRKTCVFTFSPTMMQPIHKSFTSEIISAMALSPCQNFIIGGGQETGCLFVWSSTTGDLIRLVKSHIKGIRSISFSHDGQLFASASADSAVKVWNVWECVAVFGTGSAIKPRTTNNSHTLAVECCAFFNASQWVATCSLDRTCRVFDALTNTQLFSYTFASPLTTLAVSWDDRKICFGSNAGTLGWVDLYHVSQPDVCAPEVTVGNTFAGGHKGTILNIAFLKNSSSRVICGSADGLALVWDFLPQEFRLVREVLNMKRNILHCYSVPSITSADVAAMKSNGSVQMGKYPLDATDGRFTLPDIADFAKSGDGPKQIIAHAGLNEDELADSILPSFDHTYDKKRRKKQRDEVEKLRKAIKDARKSKNDKFAAKKSELTSIMDEITQLETLKAQLVAKLAKAQK